ncbi:DUF421 domain-containing protein [Clostridium perfringens]|nr:DUF421 domain-containing protein [Clostridium perfringens]
MEDFIDVLVRSVVTYFTLLLFTRIMGRKQISQLTYFDYIVGITIGSTASIASVDKHVSLYEGIFSIAIWCIITILISEITLRNIKLRLLIDSEPLIIIENGKVNYKNMKKARYNMGDLLMQLRDKDIFYITEVEGAILEPNGTLSVLKKAEYTPLTVGDFNIKKPKTDMMVELILDGIILTSHLKKIKKDKKWVIKELKKRNISDLRTVVFAGLQSDGQIYTVTNKT